MSQVKCTGKSSRTGKPCRRPPIKGGTVCTSHGGAAPQVQRAAATRLAFADAAAAVRRMGFAPVADPLSQLGQVVGEMVAVKDRLGSIVEKWDDLDEEGMLAYDDKGMEQMRAQFTAYAGMLNSLVTACAAMGKLNIDERLAKVQENQAMAMIRALELAMSECGIIGEPARLLKLSLGKHLAAAS